MSSRLVPPPRVYFAAGFYDSTRTQNQAPPLRFGAPSAVGLRAPNTLAGTLDIRGAESSRFAKVGSFFLPLLASLAFMEISALRRATGYYFKIL